VKLCLVIMVLAFIQNVSFSIVSRSRNRNNMKYYLIASIFSNGVWFLTFRALVTSQMNLLLFPFYTVGTVVGSVCGAKLSMRIESWLGAASDDHIKRDRIAELEARMAGLELHREAVAAALKDLCA
jgi:hypothetical protein